MGCGSSIPAAKEDIKETNVQAQAQPDAVMKVVVPAQAKVEPAAAQPDERKVIQVAKKPVEEKQDDAVLDFKAEPPSPKIQSQISDGFQSWNKPKPIDVLKLLIDGNKRFLAGTSAHPHQDLKRIQAISAKQFPIAAILGCADSRVPAEIVFDQGFGDIFVCRVAGNIATPEEIASLEYAVLDLGVRLIMILGHTQCGAVKAAMSGKSFPGFIDTLVDQLDVAIERSKQSFHQNVHHSAEEVQKAHVDHVVKENVLYQIKRATRSSIISTAISKGELMIVGGVYNLATGRVEMVRENEDDLEEEYAD